MIRQKDDKLFIFYKSGTEISVEYITKYLSLSREQSRVVTGLLTGHNALCRHLHLMGLRDSPLCRKCGAEDEISAHILSV
jgi:hypothetical protein